MDGDIRVMEDYKLQIEKGRINFKKITKSQNYGELYYSAFRGTRRIDKQIYE